MVMDQLEWRQETHGRSKSSIKVIMSSTELKIAPRIPWKLKILSKELSSMMINTMPTTTSQSSKLTMKDLEELWTSPRNRTKLTASQTRAWVLLIQALPAPREVNQNGHTPVETTSAQMEKTARLRLTRAREPTGLSSSAPMSMVISQKTKNGLTLNDEHLEWW